MTSDKPKVSVLCLAFNQINYISQALESFVNQKTKFSFEVLVNDDASTDGTKEMIREYTAKYPGIVKGVFHEENEYSRGMRGILARNLLPIAAGDYISLCEGDDFFTDMEKLQVQADYLDANRDCSVCFHPVKVFFENEERASYIYPRVHNNKIFTVENLLKKNYIQTNSVMYRKTEYSGIPEWILPGDWYLHLYHANRGNIGFINRVMSAYRRHSGGIWWEADKDYGSFIEKHGAEHMAMYYEALKLFRGNKKYAGILLDKLSYIKYEIIRRNGTSLEKLKAYTPPDGLQAELEKYEKSTAKFFKIRTYRALYRLLRKMYRLIAGLIGIFRKKKGA